MLDARYLRHAFLLFQLVLGAALLWGSLHTVIHLGASDPHALVIGSVEALAAVAFLVPRTMRAGAGVLLVVIALAFVIHALRGEWRADRRARAGARLHRPVVQPDALPGERVRGATGCRAGRVSLAQARRGRRIL